MRLLRSDTSNRFCVPAALALLTDRHVDEITTLMKEYLGDEPISGVFYPVALAILRNLGYKTEKVSNLRYIRPSIPLLCCSRSHMFVIHEGKLYDNSHPEGTDAPRRLKILHAFEVTK